jgi:hypothetical protein
LYKKTIKIIINLNKKQKTTQKTKNIIKKIKKYKKTEINIK